LRARCAWTPGALNDTLAPSFAKFGGRHVTLLDPSSFTHPPTEQPPRLDPAKLNAFMAKAVDDWGSLTSAALVIGDKLGLYEALADAGPATPVDLARRIGIEEGCSRPWLTNQAAGGYLEYEPTTGRGDEG
jgi:hypothetical protein